MSPIDKKKLDGLLKEIKNLKERVHETPKKLRTLPSFKMDSLPYPEKKSYLLQTEKKAYFWITHHYKIAMLSIDDTATAIQVWIKGILPKLLTHHGLDPEEWERIADLGDNDSQVQDELIEDWKIFYNDVIKPGKIDSDILSIIGEGRSRVEKMREEK
jgi:hypothetical protein